MTQSAGRIETFVTVGKPSALKPIGKGLELIAANRLIEILPSLVEASARGLADSNLTVLNGTQGVNEVVAGLVGQGLSILDTLNQSTAVPRHAGPVPVPAVENGRLTVDAS